MVHTNEGERDHGGSGGDLLSVDDDAREELVLGLDFDRAVWRALLDLDAVARAQDEELEKERRGGATGSLRGNQLAAIPA